MSAIEAASVKISTLVDGTLRLVCDVEPRNAQAAFALFATPGTPMAIAALKPARPALLAVKTSVGELCLWAIQRCKEPIFWDWLSRMTLTTIEDADMAKQVILKTCGIHSRKDLDTNEKAAALFHKRIREPYHAWLALQEQPA